MDYTVYMNIEEILSPAYIVGGSVRDKLLDRDPHDYDFTTPLLPDDIETAIKKSGRRAYTTGKRFGTIGFNHQGKFIEVTTFRSEKYNSNRKPDVEFVTSIDTDLSRRDFTMNAIALRNNRYIDPFGGRNDINNRIIRSVGNPTLRFTEDPLRMLRAARFVGQLGFTIEESTLISMKKNAYKVMEVSRERWMQELDKLLVSDNVVSGLDVLMETDLLRFLLPELRIQYGYNQNSDYHELTLWEHTTSTVKLVPKDINLRWAALLHDIGKPFVRTDNKRGSSNYVFHDVIGAELVYGIGKRLKWSNERLQIVQDLVRNHLNDESPLRKADNSSKSRIPS
jgi:putative nucleotidyltransferase with HDIG domain